MTSTPTKLRVGIVGLGMGKSHISAYRQDPNCEVMAICDTDPIRLDRAARDMDVPEKFTDAQALFDSGHIDVVSIATPNVFHAPLSVAAMRAGLHVLCEKPMAMNVTEAQEMIDVAQVEGRKLAIHFNHRMNPSIMTLRRYVDAGDFGNIYFARTTWHRRRGIPGRASFLSKQNAGGGAMIDLGVHMLDQTLFLMGHPKVESVSATTYRKFDQKDVPDIDMDVEDFAVSFIRFTNGATLEMEISWASHHDHPEQTIVQIYGSKGGAKCLVENYKEVSCSIHRREHDALVDATLARTQPLHANVQTDLLAAIREDRKPLCDAEHGLITMQILGALYASARSGREIRMDELTHEAE